MSDVSTWKIEDGGHLWMIVDDADNIIAEGIEREVAERIIKALAAEGEAARLREALRKAIRSHENLAEVVFTGPGARQYRDEAVRIAYELEAALADAPAPAR